MILVKHACFPVGVQEDLPWPYPPLRWLVFCFSVWEAAKEHLSLLWLRVKVLERLKAVNAEVCVNVKFPYMSTISNDRSVK